MRHPKRRTAPWIAQQFANGVNSWLHINGGYSDLFDRRGARADARSVRRLRAGNRISMDAQSGARGRARVFAPYAGQLWRRETHARYLDSVRGFYCALLEAHIPFDVISDKFIDHERLRRYRVLVLPNMACVADASAAAIERSSRWRRPIVATFDAGVATVDGAVRGAAGVRRISSVVVACGRRERTQILVCEDRGGRRSAARPGIGDTDLIPNEGALVEVEPDAERTVPLTLIPPVIAHSGATISIPGVQRDPRNDAIPLAVRGTHGRRPRRLFLPTRWTRSSIATAFPDLGRVLANAVRYALANAHAGVEVDAPEFVDVDAHGAARRRLVHLINFPVAKHVNTGWRHAGATSCRCETSPCGSGSTQRSACAKCALQRRNRCCRVRAHGPVVRSSCRGSTITRSSFSNLHDSLCAR